MKRINVTIEGQTPLLMNSPKAMLEPQEEVTTKTKKYDQKAEAEKVAYKTKSGFLYVPNTALKGCLINASAWKKAGKYALKPIIAGGVRVPVEELIIKDKKGKPLKSYDIDLRTVVIQRARVVKARPKIFDWKLDFELLYNEQLIPNPEIIKTVLEEGGDRVGLLDFRPAKTGEFGTFKVTKFN